MRERFSRRTRSSCYNAFAFDWGLFRCCSLDRLSERLIAEYKRTHFTKKDQSSSGLNRCFFRVLTSCDSQVLQTQFQASSQITAITSGTRNTSDRSRNLLSWASDQVCSFSLSLEETRGTWKWEVVTSRTVCWTSSSTCTQYYRYAAGALHLHSVSKQTVTSWQRLVLASLICSRQCVCVCMCKSDEGRENKDAERGGWEGTRR